MTDKKDRYTQDGPEGIFLQPSCCASPDTGRLWCEHDAPEDCDERRPWTPYIRADLHSAVILQRDVLQARVQELEARVPKLALPSDGAYVIHYDDQDRKPEHFARSGALEGAMARYKQISDSWNAHLYVKIDSNCNDTGVPNATTLSEAPRHD